MTKYPALPGTFCMRIYQINYNIDASGATVDISIIVYPISQSLPLHLFRYAMMRKPRYKILDSHDYDLSAFIASDIPCNSELLQILRLINIFGGTFPQSLLKAFRKDMQEYYVS